MQLDGNVNNIMFHIIASKNLLGVFRVKAVQK